MPRGKRARIDVGRALAAKRKEELDEAVFRRQEDIVAEVSRPRFARLAQALRARETNALVVLEGRSSAVREVWIDCERKTEQEWRLGERTRQKGRRSFNRLWEAH